MHPDVEPNITETRAKLLIFMGYTLVLLVGAGVHVAIDPVVSSSSSTPCDLGSGDRFTNHSASATTTMVPTTTSATTTSVAANTEPSWLQLRDDGWVVKTLTEHCIDARLPINTVLWDKTGRLTTACASSQLRSQHADLDAACGILQADHAPPSSARQQIDTMQFSTPGFVLPHGVDVVDIVADEACHRGQALSILLHVDTRVCFQPSAVSRREGYAFFGPDFVIGDKYTNFASHSRRVDAALAAGRQTHIAGTCAPVFDIFAENSQHVIQDTLPQYAAVEYAVHLLNLPKLSVVQFNDRNRWGNYLTRKFTNEEPFFVPNAASDSSVFCCDSAVLHLPAPAFEPGGNGVSRFYRRAVEVVTSSLPDPGSDIVLFLSRIHATNGRNPVNEPDLLAAVKTWSAEAFPGVPVVTFSHGDFDSDVQLVRRAVAIVGIHGGAFMNTVWARDETWIFEILVGGKQNGRSWIGMIAGIDHRRYMQIVNPCPNGAADCEPDLVNVFVDCEVVLNRLRAAIPRIRGGR